MVCIESVMRCVLVIPGIPLGPLSQRAQREKSKLLHQEQHWYFILPFYTVFHSFCCETYTCVKTVLQMSIFEHYCCWLIKFCKFQSLPSVRSSRRKLLANNICYLVFSTAFDSNTQYKKVDINWSPMTNLRAKPLTLFQLGLRPSQHLFLA